MITESWASFSNTVCKEVEHWRSHRSFCIILFIPSEPNLPMMFRYCFVSINSGTVDGISEFFAACDINLKHNRYKFSLYFKRKYILINIMPLFNTISRLWDKPFDPIDSDNCLLWHQLAKNVITEQKSIFAVLCKSGKWLLALLEHQKRRSDVSPERSIARQQSSSFKLKYLSPASATKRKMATQMEGQLKKQS